MSVTNGDLSANRRELERMLDDAGMSVEQGQAWLLLAVHDELAAIRSALELPEREFTLHDSVTLDSNGAGTVAFKNAAQLETWAISSWVVDSEGAHNVTPRVFSDPNKAAPLNLVDTKAAGSTLVGDRNAPILVAPGHFLVVSLASGTSGDTVRVTVQGWRQTRRFVAPRRARARAR